MDEIIDEKIKEIFNEFIKIQEIHKKANNIAHKTFSDCNESLPNFIEINELERQLIDLSINKLSNVQIKENFEIHETTIQEGKKSKPRKRRNRHKKRAKKNSTSGFSISFSIKAVSSPKDAVVFRLRKSTNGRINLQSFYKHKFPYVIQSKLNLSSGTNDCDSNIKKTICHGTMKNNESSASWDPSNLQSVVKKKKLKENEEKTTFFENYFSQQKVQVMLNSGELIKGSIRINPRNYKEAYVNNINKNAQDYLITSLIDRNRALEGDVVILKVNPKSKWRENQQTARVVFIEQKVHPRTAVGYLSLMKDKNKRFATFSPRDSRIPKIKIPAFSWPEGFYTNHQQYKNILFLAKITEWTDTHYAIGLIIDKIGKNKEIEVETKALLLENDLYVQPFPQQLFSYLPTNSIITEEDLKNREDLRKDCIFTIDPLTARDLDDAVSCKFLPNGNVDVGVHIADVSYYLHEGTPLDALVSQKANTIYLVNDVYHMLPVELCQLCSLLPGKDSLTFSVFWEMTKDGEIISTRFERTVINSCCQLAYEHAQCMIDDPINFNTDQLPEIVNGFTPKYISGVVNCLQKIAINLREKRFRNGALRIDQTKLTFRLDPQTGLPIDYSVYENKPAHRLIEEFMLLANISVAKRILNDFPTLALLRCHEGPNARMLDETKKTLANVGIHIDVESSGSLQSSIWKYDVDKSILGNSRMQVLNHLLAKPMVRANYFCAGVQQYHHHYALNIPIYTHFTSPIRRYPDIIVHRLLSASLGYTDSPKWGIEFVQYIANNCNRQKLNAKRAGEASAELFLAYYIENHQPFIESAVVVDVREKSYDVMIIKTGTIVRMYPNAFEDSVTYNVEAVDDSKKLYRITVNFPEEENLSASTVILELFQLITVSLHRKKNTYKLQAKLLRNNPILQPLPELFN